LAASTALIACGRRRRGCEYELLLPQRMTERELRPAGLVEISPRNVWVRIDENDSLSGGGIGCLGLQSRNDSLVVAKPGDEIASKRRSASPCSERRSHYLQRAEYQRKKHAR
jgi:hypothetical protein